MIILLRIGCLIFGHGEFKQYWRVIEPGVTTSEVRCKICGAHK